MTNKILFFTLLSASLFNAQTTIFSENFEPESATVAQWGVQDLDGDGFNWHIVMGSEYTDAAGFLPGNMAASTGYNTDPAYPPSGPLNPNNIVVSPDISIPALGANETVTLKYKVGPYLNQLAAMSYSMYILPASVPFDIATATAIRTKAFTGMGAINESVNISSFAGQNIKIYFRHHNGAGQWYLLLDDVIVEKSAQMAVNEDAKTTWSVYPNPASEVIRFKGIEKIDSYEIYDLSGKLISKGKKASDAINVSTLRSGKYMIVIQSGNKNYSNSFIKK